MSSEAVRVFLRIRPKYDPETESVLEVDNNSVTVSSAGINGSENYLVVPKTPQNSGSRRGASATPKQLQTPRSNRKLIARTPKQSWKTPGRIKKVFKFEKIFHRDDVESSAMTLEDEQQQVFESTTKPLVDQVLRGRSATCLAYGSTGSGKSLTVLGNENVTGVAFRAISYLFETISSDSTLENEDVSVTLSFVELYKDQFRDLLSQATPSDSQSNIEIRQDKFGMFLTGSETLRTNVTNSSEAFDAIQRGLRRRTVGSTSYNASSSRSHCILTLELRMAGDSNAPRFSKLRIVDLAGSERQGLFTDENGHREVADKESLAEAQFINLSLSTLASVLMSLSKNQQESWIAPYRNSKLTWLLRDSLGGTASTVMITHARQDAMYLQQTVQTLAFASRTKQIANVVCTSEQLENISQNNELSLFMEKTKAVERVKFLEAKCKELQENLQQKNDTESKLTERDGKLTRELSEIQTNFENVAKENEKLSQELLRAKILSDPLLYEQYRELQASAMVQKRHAIEIEERLVQSLNDHQVKCIELKQVHKQLAEESEKLKRTERENFQLKKEVALLNVKDVETRKSCLLLQDQLRLAQIDQTTTDRLLLELSSEMHSATDSFEQSLSEGQHLRQAVTYLQDQIEAIGKQAMEDLLGVQQELTLSNQNVSKMEGNNFALQDDLSQKNEEITNLGAQLKSLQSQLEESMERESQQQHLISSLKDEVQQLSSQEIGVQRKRKSNPSQEKGQAKRTCADKLPGSTSTECGKQATIGCSESDSNLEEDTTTITESTEETTEPGITDPEQDVQEENAEKNADLDTCMNESAEEQQTDNSLVDGVVSSPKPEINKEDVDNKQMEFQKVQIEIPHSPVAGVMQDEALLSASTETTGLVYSPPIPSQQVAPSTLDKDDNACPDTSKRENESETQSRSQVVSGVVTRNNLVENGGSGQGTTQDLVAPSVEAVETSGSSQDLVSPSVEAVKTSGSSQDLFVPSVEAVETGGSSQETTQDEVTNSKKPDGAEMTDDSNEYFKLSTTKLSQNLSSKKPKRPLEAIDLNAMSNDLKNDVKPLKLAKATKKPRTKRQKANKSRKMQQPVRSTLFAAFVDSNSFAIPKLKKQQRL